MDVSSLLTTNQDIMDFKAARENAQLQSFKEVEHIKDVGFGGYCKVWSPVLGPRSTVPCTHV